MIRFIAALDIKNGIANDQGIPWQGKIPSDVTYFRNQTIHGVLMMGYGWYLEQKQPLSERRNLVATTKPDKLRDGFEKVTDAREFLSSFEGDIWVGGGAKLFEATLDLADELYLTKLEQDFNCTKFFPDYSNRFVLGSSSEMMSEGGINYRFEVWKRRT